MSQRGDLSPCKLKGGSSRQLTRGYIKAEGRRYRSSREEAKKVEAEGIKA
mgnify:FL=1